MTDDKTILALYFLAPTIFTLFGFVLGVLCATAVREKRERRQTGKV